MAVRSLWKKERYDIDVIFGNTDMSIIVVDFWETGYGLLEKEGTVEVVALYRKHSQESTTFLVKSLF